MKIQDTILFFRNTDDNNPVLLKIPSLLCLLLLESSWFPIFDSNNKVLPTSKYFSFEDDNSKQEKVGSVE